MEESDEFFFVLGVWICVSFGHVKMSLFSSDFLSFVWSIIWIGVFFFIVTLVENVKFKYESIIKCKLDVEKMS